MKAQLDYANNLKYRLCDICLILPCREGGRPANREQEIKYLSWGKVTILSAKVQKQQRVKTWRAVK